MTRRRKIVAGGLIALAIAGAAAWHWQSQLIGIGARWWLARIAAREEATGDLTTPPRAVARTHKLLLMPPPPDALVPELFDLVTTVSSRVATGEIDLAWAAWIYTSYERDLVRDRPAGAPRRSMPEVEGAVVEYMKFYSIQKRPEVPGVRVRDFVDGGPDSYTVEEIERADREGRQLPLR